MLRSSWAVSHEELAEAVAEAVAEAAA